MGSLKTLTLGNGAVTTYTYNANTQRLSNLLTTAGGATIQNLSYAFDNQGNIAAITDGVNGAHSQTLTYDALDRLVTALGGYGTKSYAYNELGDLASYPEQPQSGWIGESLDTVITEAGNPQLVENGRIGNGLYFDGASRARLGGTDMALSTAFTLEANLRPELLTGEGAGRAGGFALRVLSTGTVQGVVTTSGSGTITLSSTGSATAGVWSHLVLTYDGSTTKLYVNGALRAQQAATGTVGGATNPVVLGGSGFKGMVDEVYLFPRALTAGEVSARFARLPNLVPFQPMTPAPTGGSPILVVNTSATFQFVSWDLENDSIKYRINWGTGPLEETGYYLSGQVVSVTHSWTATGLYNVQVQAAQGVGSSTTSAWSPTYTVRVATGVSGRIYGSLVLAGGFGGLAASSAKRVYSVGGEGGVGKSTSSAKQAHWGYGAGVVASAWADDGLGAQGAGGQEPIPPEQPSYESLLALAGTTGGELAQITQSLGDNPLGEATDGNGNLRIKNQRWIKYDGENRPIRIITLDGTKTEFTYDYEGQRIKKTVTPSGGSATTTLYIGDLYEKTGSTITITLFAGGQRIATKTGTTLRYFHQDHLGSTSLVTDSAGAVVQTTRYTPFGNVYESSGSVTDIGYTGHRADASDGLIYMRARYYDPGTGRFLTPDTIVPDVYDPQTLNRYAYVSNNPINYTDPTGHWKFKLRNFLAAPFIGIPAFNINHWHAPTMWNRNRDSIVNAVIAFVASGGNPIAAAASFGATQFVQSHGGQTTVRNTATILYKNNLMGGKESQIFSEFLWYTVASMSIEAGLSSMSGGLAGEPQPSEFPRDQSILDNGSGTNIGYSPQHMVANNRSGLKLMTYTTESGNQSIVASAPNQLPLIQYTRLPHTSITSPSLTASGTSSWSRFTRATSFFHRGTCHQYVNSGLLRIGAGSATVGGWGYLTNAIYGNYGGQFLPKIAYSTWESEK